MVAKGLDLENVTLVGALDADLSLYVDSYRAAETTFNMLTQVVGRAGRGNRPGRAMIQTMTPDHAVITLAAKQDYDGFYDLELPLRQAKGCPPFLNLYTITFTGQEEGRVMQCAAAFRDSLSAALVPWGGAQVFGPAPAAVAKINYQFRYRLTLRSAGGKALRQQLGVLLRDFARNRANRGVTAYIDVNAYD